MFDISYDYSDKRKFKRLTHPAKAIIEGQEYEISDWSENAFKIEHYTGNLRISDETTALVKINFQGFKLDFSRKIRVIRAVHPGGCLVAEYIDPSSKGREVLAFFSRGIITGETRSFDVITEPFNNPVTENYVRNYFQPEPESKSFFPKKGPLVFVAVFIGVLILLHIFEFFHTNIYFMQVDSAVVTSRTEILNSPVKGILSEIYTEKGKKLHQDQPIFKVINPELQGEIEEKKIIILKNRALLKEKEKQLADGLQLRQIAFLEDELAKKETLYGKKLVSKPEIDDLQGRILELKRELALLRAQKERIAEIISINEKDLDFSRSINSYNTVKAPFSAVVEEVLAFKGKYVDEKTPVVMIKPDSSGKFIQAYLKEAQPHNLTLNSRVYIEIPLYDVELEGVLADMRKEDNLITAVIEPEDDDLLKEVELGTPVRISFKKKHPWLELK